VSIDKIHVEISGNGPALVLIHGWGLNSVVWHKIIPQLEQSFEVHAVDLPGFGLSHQLAAPKDLHDWVERVVDVIDKPAIWLGWSLGGLVATQAALSYPSRVLKLITVASTPRFGLTEDWPGMKPDVLGLFQQELAQDFSQTLARFLAIQAMGSESAKQDILELKQMLKLRPLPCPIALKVGLELLERVDLRAQLSNVDMPFLRIYGRLDSLVSRHLISKIDALAPQSQRVILAKSSHAPFISHKAEFVSHLMDFIRYK